jgi:hypothetical protein
MKRERRIPVSSRSVRVQTSKIISPPSSNIHQDQRVGEFCCMIVLMLEGMIEPHSRRLKYLAFDPITALCCGYLQFFLNIRQ